MDFDTCERQALAHQAFLLREAERDRIRSSTRRRKRRGRTRARAASVLRALADRLEPRWEARVRLLRDLARGEVTVDQAMRRLG